MNSFITFLKMNNWEEVNVFDNSRIKEWHLLLHYKDNYISKVVNELSNFFVYIGSTEGLFAFVGSLHCSNSSSIFSGCKTKTSNHSTFDSGTCFRIYCNFADFNSLWLICLKWRRHPCI